jgi:chromosome segregation ATPase
MSIETDLKRAECELKALLARAERPEKLQQAISKKIAAAKKTIEEKKSELAKQKPWAERRDCLLKKWRAAIAKQKALADKMNVERAKIRQLTAKYGEIDEISAMQKITTNKGMRDEFAKALQVCKAAEAEISELQSKFREIGANLRKYEEAWLAGFVTVSPQQIARRFVAELWNTEGGS